MGPFPPGTLSDILMIACRLRILIQLGHSHDFHPFDFWREFCLRLFLSLEIKYTNKLRLLAPVKRETLKIYFSWRFIIFWKLTRFSQRAPLGGGGVAERTFKFDSVRNGFLSARQIIWEIRLRAYFFFWGSFLDNEKAGIFSFLNFWNVRLKDDSFLSLSVLFF